MPAGGGVLAGKLLAAEWSDGVVSAWSIDANGDPVSGTRQVVIAGIDGPGGGAVDPLTGDVLFTDNGGRLVVLRAGASVGGITSYGTPSPGASGTPQLSGSGVAHVGCTVTLHVHHAPHALGVLAYGIVAADVTLSGLRVLTTTDVIFASILDGSGDQSWPLALPPEPALGLHHFYFQAGYLDASTSMGLVASAGLDLLVN